MTRVVLDDGSTSRLFTASNMRRGTKFKLKPKNNRATRENKKRQKSSCSSKHHQIGRQQAREVGANVDSSSLALKQQHENEQADRQHKSSFDESEFQPAQAGSTSETSTAVATTNVFDGDELLGAESRISSLQEQDHRSSSLGGGSQLRKLLFTRPSLFLSSIVPQTFTRPLVLERPRASFERARGYSRHSQPMRLNDEARHHRAVGVPWIRPTIPIPRGPQSGGRPRRIAPGLIVFPNHQHQQQQPPVGPMLMVRRPPEEEAVPPDSSLPPPVGMFDDDGEAENAATGSAGAASTDRDAERELDHIDQLIKDEFESRLTLNEHIVREPNLSRAPAGRSSLSPAPETGFDSARPTTLIPVTTTEYDASVPTSTSTTRPDGWSPNRMPAKTPSHASEDGGVGQQMLADHPLGSIEAEFRPVKPVASMNARQDNKQTKLALAEASSTSERKSPSSWASFVPTDPETIAHLNKQKASDNENRAFRFSRDSNGSNNSSSLWHTNRIRAAQSSPSSSVLPVHQQSNEQSQAALLGYGGKQIGLTKETTTNFMGPAPTHNGRLTASQLMMSAQPIAESTGLRHGDRPTAVSHQEKPSLGQQRLANAASHVGLASADLSDSHHRQQQQHQLADSNQANFYHQQQREHPINALSETLKRLRETKAKIKQLQAEINSTDPAALLLLDRPSSAALANGSRAPIHMEEANQNGGRQRLLNERRFSAQIQSVAEAADSSAGQQLALSNGSPVRILSGQPVPTTTFNGLIYPKTTNPFTAPARLMVSAFGRAAQSAIATRQPPDYSSWPSLALGSTTSSRIPLPQSHHLAANTTSAPIILSSTMSVATAPTFPADQPSTTPNPLDAVQLAKPVDLSPGLVVTTPPAAAAAAAVAVASVNNDEQATTDYYSNPRKVAVTNREQNGQNLSKIASHHTGTEPKTSESADSRIDTRVIKLPPAQQITNVPLPETSTTTANAPATTNKHPNKPYQFRYQERPRSATETNDKTVAAHKRQEQSMNDNSSLWSAAASGNTRPAAASGSHQVANHYGTTTSETIDRMSSNDSAGNDNRANSLQDQQQQQQQPPATPSGSSIGQSFRRFLDQTGQTVGKLFGGLSSTSVGQRAESAQAAPLSNWPKLTTERVLYLLISFICSMALLCMLAVFAAVRWQARKSSQSIEIATATGTADNSPDGNGPKAAGSTSGRLDWRKLVASSSQGYTATADRWRRDNRLILDGTMRNVSLLARQHHQTGAKKQVENKKARLQMELQQQLNLPAPLFKQSCCHCVACSESWLFRDDGDTSGRRDRRSGENSQSRQPLCSSGFYHPAPRGKLPFGAASSVNKLLDGRTATKTNTKQQGETSNLSPASPLALFGRPPIGGTRLRMMSAIDERPDHDNNNNNNNDGDTDDDLQRCSCPQHQHQHQQLKDRLFVRAAAAAASCPSLDNNRRAELQDDNVGSQEHDDLCNCCNNGDRYANSLTDCPSGGGAFNDTPPRLLDRESLGNISGESLVECNRHQQHQRRPTNHPHRVSQSRQLEQQQQTNCRQDDSINIIRGRAPETTATTTTCAKTAANCERDACGDNNKCSGKLRAKLTAGGGAGSNNLEPSRRPAGRESGNQQVEDQRQQAEATGYGDARLRGAKGVLSPLQLAMPFEQQLSYDHKQGCHRNSQRSLGSECLHEEADANHHHQPHRSAATFESGRCDQVGQHQSSRLADSAASAASFSLAANLQQETNLRYKLIGEQQQHQRLHQNQQARRKA